MINITYVAHSGICPQWGVRVTVSAKYRFTENPKNPHEAAYMTYCVKCPILENIKLPERKKDKQYGLFRFCKISDNCELLKYPFKEVIDVSRDGYSQ